MDRSEKYLKGWMAYVLANCYKKSMAHFGREPFYSLMDEIISKKDFRYIVTQISILIKRLKDCDELKSQISSAENMATIYEHIMSKKIPRHEIHKVILKRVAQYSKNRSINCKYTRRLKDLQTFFKLNECEMDIIMIGFLMQTNSNFDEVCRDMDIHRISNLAGAIKKSGEGVAAALKKNGPLYKYLLRESIYSLDRLKLDPYVICFLSGHEETLDFFYKQYNGSSFNLDSFLIEKKETQVLSNLLTQNKRGLNILFYGEAGTGKTELSKSLAKQLNKKLYFINDENNNEGVKKRLASLEACINSVDIDNSVIVVDEADSILNTECSHLISGENVEKGFINKTLEQTPAKIIWIANNVYRVENSVLRRFMFSLNFKRLNRKQRASTWKNILTQKAMTDFLQEDEIKNLADKYEVNVSGISMALDSVKCDYDGPKHHAVERMESILKNHEILIYGERTPKILNNSTNYSLEGLNMDVDPEHILSILRSFNNCNSESIRNMNVLLCGAPGTGKTEFARFLSRELDIELVSKTASELISCYLGETEKNIRMTFREAQEQKAILFIDEADSFLYPRESAQRSWEISQTNEILCQMESYKGILVCATNFYKSIDPASIRRFNIKVNFDFLNTEGKLSFYKKIFSSIAQDMRDEDVVNEGLSRISNLTPGDFKIVYQKNFYLGSVTHEKLLNDLMLESNSKSHTISKVIGFQ